MKHLNRYTIKYINLIVIKTNDIQKAKTFYELLGITFQTEKHGKGPVHFAATIENCVFEIYPSENTDVLDGTRIGFAVSNIYELINKIAKAGYEVTVAPKKTKWGVRAVVKAPDGRSVELIES